MTETKKTKLIVLLFLLFLLLYSTNIMSQINSLYPSMETMMISDVITGKKSVNEVKLTFLKEVDIKGKKTSITNSNISKILTTIDTSEYIKPYIQDIVPSGYGQISYNNPMCSNMIHTDGIRQVILVRKSLLQKIGLGLVSIDSCIYVSHIEKDSPASKIIRFGDQIIRINSLETAGLNGKDVINYIKNLGLLYLTILIRDRPLHKVYELYKDEHNHLGIGFKNGIITHLERNSSASKNGMPIKHKIVEVNTINVVGLSDAELVKIFQESNIQVYISIIKTRDYNELISSITKKKMQIMEHSIMLF